MTTPDETRAGAGIIAAAGSETAGETARRLAAEVDRGKWHMADAITEVVIRSGCTVTPEDATDMIREAQAAGPAEVHDATLTFPAIRAQDPAPVAETRPPAIHCPGCGETFAEAGFGGRALFLAETLHAAALDAGWSEDGGRWKCSVCLAGITGPLYGPEREPVPSMAGPDTDPYEQSSAVLAEADIRRPRFWAETNRSNNATVDRNKLRFRDGFQGFEELFDRTPGLESDPEAAVALRSYEAELTGYAEAMHRASLERLEELRSARSALYLETEVAA